MQNHLSTRSLKALLVGLLMLAGLVLAACGDNTATSTTAPTTIAATTARATTAAPTTAAATTAPATTAAATIVATTVAATAAPATTIAPTTAAPTTVGATTVAPTTAASATTVAAPANKLKVVATTTQVGDFVKNVGGNRIELTTILKPNADPHDYEPTADDSKALASAQIVFTNGIGLDEWLDKVIQNSGTKAKKVVTSDGIKPRPGEGEEEKEGDPHIWFSVDNVKLMVDNISKGLSGLDAAGASVYQANATTYKEQLDKLDKDIKAQIATIPEADRKLVTNHDAFGYYLDRYGIKFIGSVIPSFDSTAEPSAKDLADLVAKIKAEKVKAIFTESSLNPKLEQQIAAQGGVKIYSNLYGDTLGEAGSDGDTYIKMMQTNTKNIVAGLIGK